MEKNKILQLVDDYVKNTDVERLRMLFNLTENFPKNNIYEFLVKNRDIDFLEIIAEKHWAEIERKYFFFKDTHI